MLARAWHRASVGTTFASLLFALSLLPASDGGDFTQQPLLSPAGVVGWYPVSGPGVAFADPAGSSAAKTSGGRTAWEHLACPGGLYLRQVAMATPQVGYVCGELGVVIKTTNGGASWQTVMNTGFPYYWYGCVAFDPNSVLVAGFQNQSGDGVIRWSDDGGATWGPIQVLPGQQYAQWLSYTRFADRNHGIIQAFGGGIQYTLTGGRTPADWTYVRPTNNWWQGPFTFFDDGRAWMTGYDNFRSTDYGVTWQAIADADPLFDGPDSVLWDCHGLIGGGTISPTVSGWIYRSAHCDFSASTRVATPPYPVRALLFLNGGRAFGVGGNVYSNVGGIWGSTDGGATWQLEQDIGAELLDINFVRIDDTHLDLYAVGMISQIWRQHLTLDTRPGDLNCDGAVTFDDINPFVAALSGRATYYGQWSGCNWMNADCNADGQVNFDDINPFVALLSGN